MLKPGTSWRITLVLLALTSSAIAAVDEPADEGAIPETIGFNRDVRPILSENCFACHGPDKNKRKGDLRLDNKEGGAFVNHDGAVPLVAGNPQASDLYRRVISSEPDVVMPPAKSGKKLTPRQIQVLTKWIAQGAAWQPLWSFIPPQSPPLPAVVNARWPRNSIDRFILTRLEKEKLLPSAEADKATLVRRVTLDLIGLPPTPAEVDAFLADPAPDAYEKVVDRLLANTHFGERMGMDWLDAARYADTHGYHIDSGRDMTRWREWVIDAYNHNMPFDEFAVEQLAGDLLPNATLEQKIASGFNRNNMVNFEGGAVAQEYQTAYCIDRVNTTSTVFLGLTVACAQCHDHKFDPIAQRDFYRLFAFFHNVPENGLDGAKGNAVPVLPTPTREQQQRLDALAASVDQMENEFLAVDPVIDAAQAEWESRAGAAETVKWAALVPVRMKSTGAAAFEKRPDGSIHVGGTNAAADTYQLVAPATIRKITALRLETLPDAALAGRGPGRSINGNIVMTDVRIAVSTELDSAPTPAKIRQASADFSQKDFPITAAIDADPHTGWAIFPEVGKPHTAIFELETPIETAGAILRITLDFQSQFSQHQLGHFRLSVTDSSTPRSAVPTPPKIQQLLAVKPGARTPEQQAELRSSFRHEAWSGANALKDRLAELRRARAALEGSIPTTMVMQEMPRPRDTFILMRGQYDKPTEKVTAGIPAIFGALPASSPPNRLSLARWVVDPSNPLTARVTVNRLWQTFFGTGIVKTVEDFGSQGEGPSHPALLEWLAVEFMTPAAPGNAGVKPWDVKGMVRTIVTSSTYRQASAVTPQLLERDPDNRLLARGPRFRLPAEFIRDQALAVSGLLNVQIGGASVSPYQPAGLWEELMSRSDGANWTAQTYVQSHGPDLYRRSMYTFWKRTSPPPSLGTFDAPDREVCTVRRARTNTPLQALVMMNDPTYVEASRKLAERIMTEAGGADDDRFTLAFRIVLARKPAARELAILHRIRDRELEIFQKNPTAAIKLLGVGESKRNESLNPAELAAWTVVASDLLNLDETVTKG